MQFRILPIVAVALLAGLVLAQNEAETQAAKNSPKVDALHAKCHYGSDKRWHIAENEEVDLKAQKTAFPATYVAMGWHKYKSGKCTYKRSYADCPHRDHWHHDEHHWDRHYGHTKLFHYCDENSDCCSNNCLNVRAVGGAKAANVCCKKNTLALGANCTLAKTSCCSGLCTNTTAAANSFACKALP